MKRLVIALAAFASASVAGPARAEDASAKPNVVLLLVDDAALMDIGAYGSEARTPNIDALASNGALLTGYHTSPLCSPSRSMLLTGIDNHRNGVATIEEVLPPELQGQPGYSLHLEPGVVTVASRLKQAGYRTYMTGKWHLGHGDGDLPNGHGFDRSFALDASGADNWEQKPYMPYYQVAPWFEDGKPATLPEDFYSSKFMIDQMISYLGADQDQGSPFFAYVAFQAVHIPVQAPREFSDHYKGRFDAGWEVLREARWNRAKQLGLIPANAPLASVPATMRKWSSLNDAERRIYARSMEVYAGMLEAMDHHIGRLIAHLKRTGKFENTIFILTSDNGPEPSDPVHAFGMNYWMATHGYDWRLENLGEKGSLGFIGPEWAASISSPGKLFKFYTSEGGLHVPFIISGPGIKPATRPSAPAFVTDVAPTILDLAGVAVSPAKGEVPITGKSLRPVLAGTADRTHAPDATVGFEVAGNAALFKGDFKIAKYAPPHGDNEWHLFNLATDPGEAVDLSKSDPERLATMIADYRAYEARMGVLELPPGYNVQKQVLNNAITRQLQAYWWVLLALTIAVAALGYGAWRFVVPMIRARLR